MYLCRIAVGDRICFVPQKSILNLSSAPASTLCLGFDPGRDKCGLAIVDQDRSVLCHEVVPAANVMVTIEALCQRYRPYVLVMGNQTTAELWQERLAAQFASTLPIVLVDEAYSTLEARTRYWQLYPPQGLMRLIPQGMREVPRPIDDLVAVILVERYLDGTSKSSA